MGKVVSQTRTLVHSELGAVEVVRTVIDEYDVEDMVRGKSQSQATRIKWIVDGQRADINNPTGPATIGTPYFKNSEELLD